MPTKLKIVLIGSCTKAFNEDSVRELVESKSGPHGLEAPLSSRYRWY